MAAVSGSTSAERGARILTFAYTASTFIALVTWLITLWGRHQPNWLELLVTLFNIPLSHSAASVALLALISRALLGRKRLGLIAVAACQVFGMYLGLAVLLSWPTNPLLGGLRHEHTFARWMDLVGLPIGAIILVLLWRLRPAFTGRVWQGSWWRAATVALGGLALTVAVTAGALATVNAVGDSGTLVRLLAILGRALGLTSGDTTALADLPRWIPALASGLLTTTMLVSVAVFLRYGRDVTGWSGSRELEVRRLVRAYGDADSLSYFATRRDKSVVFSPDSQAAVTYQVFAGVSIASSDPLGRPESWPAAIKAWKQDAVRYGWLPAVLAASAKGAQAYAQAGLRVMALGDEAIVDTRSFSLADKSLAPLRAAVQHARKEGVRVEFAYQADLDPTELMTIAMLAQHWRRGETERGFSMALNRLADPADGRVLFVRALDADDQLVGLLSFVPWGASGLSLDVMRRSPTAPNGVTQLMVTELLDAAPRMGVVRVSLNFCPFRRVFSQGEEFGASTAERFNSSALSILDRFWQLGRLYRSNRQYRPRWEPRFICYDDRVGLPQVAVAFGLAEGFLPRSPLNRSTVDHRLSPAELAQVAALEAEELPGVEVAEPHRPEQVRVRLDHLAELKTLPSPPYRPEARPAAQPVGRAAGAALGERIEVSGRVRSIRDHGRVVFADLSGDGASLQLLMDAEQLGGDRIRTFARLVDTGDIVTATGTKGLSRNGTPSLVVDDWAVLAKAVHPVPFGGLTDPQARLRHRSTDLIVNADQVQHLRRRSLVVRALRRVLDSSHFTEVETPILQAVHGGANARPFRTHINAYNSDLYLRIAPELYLKRLVVGGLGAVYEVGRNFRNEGADSTHNPEFTALEAYQPGGDYGTMRQLTEAMIVAAIEAVFSGAGASERPAWAAAARPWRVVPVLTAVSESLGETVEIDTDVLKLREIAQRHGVRLAARDAGAGTLIEALYAAVVEPATTDPTFYVDFPQETSPLAAAHRSAPGLAERWDLVINGMEIATGYSELTDPVDQRQRLTAQSVRAAAGDPDAMELDEDFLYALETGMPPTGGVGLGVDRLVMLLTGQNIRSVLTFPFVKPYESR